MTVSTTTEGAVEFCLGEKRSSNAEASCVLQLVIAFMGSCFELTGTENWLLSRAIWRALVVIAKRLA
jgi:hypothetical protein